MLTDVITEGVHPQIRAILIKSLKFNAQVYSLTPMPSLQILFMSISLNRINASRVKGSTACTFFFKLHPRLASRWCAGWREWLQYKDTVNCFIAGLDFTQVRIIRGRFKF
jgi:hypothetical protein